MGLLDHRRVIAGTTISVPWLGLGAAALGNLFARVEEADATALLAAAREAGVGYVDTAPYYGHGLSERRVGAALASGWAPVVSTKAGRVLVPLGPGETPSDHGFVDPDPFRPVFDYSAEGVRRSVEGSLARLGLARLDIVLMHDLGRLTHGEDHARHLKDALNRGYPALAAMKANGLIGAIGLGVNEHVIADAVLAHADLDVVLLAGRHTLLDDTALRAGFFDRCAARGVSVVIGGPFNSGLLAAPLGPEPTFDYAAAPPALVEKARRLANVCADFGVALGAAALAHAGRAPAVASVIPGPRCVSELEQILAWAKADLPDALWPALRAEGAAC
jgi:D-threo-aldose 1-dehydrogenase